MAKEQNNGSDIFSTLYEETQGNIDTMSKGPVDVSSQLEVLQREAEEVNQITDEDEKKQREVILATKFDTLREAIKNDDQDMAKAIYGMKVLIDGMDSEFQGLISFSKAEEAIIKQAEEALQNAETNAKNALAAITVEENDDGFLNLGWGKTSRVNEAKQVSKDANLAVKKAKSDIETAQQRADEMKRERLMSAEIGDTLNLIQVMGQKTVDIMKERTTSIKESLDAIKARKQSAFDIRNDAENRTEKLLADVEQLEAELEGEELAIDSFDAGPEKAKQVEKISNMRTNLEELRGKLKVAQAVLDEKTKSIQEHEAFELGQQKLLSNHRMWIATLQSKLQEDLVKDAAYLEMLQAAADQEIAQNVDGMSDEKNARQMENVAKIIVSSDKAYVEKMEKTPEQIRRRANIESALAKHKANLSESEAVLRQLYIDNYGIDPLQASEFTHANDDSDTSNEADDTPVSPATPADEKQDLFGG